MIWGSHSSSRGLPSRSCMCGSGSVSITPLFKSALIRAHTNPKLVSGLGIENDADIACLGPRECHGFKHPVEFTTNQPLEP